MEKTQDAVALLKADHKAVEKLFKQFDKLQEDEQDEKLDLVKQICSDLIVHTQIEEEIFYPAVRKALQDDDMLNEAEVEHASAKDLIKQLQSMKPGDELYDAKVTVLGEYVMHHVEEEENEMFPKVKKAKLDLQQLGDSMAQRKEDLEMEIDAKSGAQRSAAKPASGKRVTH